MMRNEELVCRECGARCDIEDDGDKAVLVDAGTTTPHWPQCAKVRAAPPSNLERQARAQRGKQDDASSVALDNGPTICVGDTQSATAR